VLEFIIKKGDAEMMAKFTWWWQNKIDQYNKSQVNQVLSKSA